jgi:hypothetical protein
MKEKVINKIIEGIVKLGLAALIFFICVSGLNNNFRKGVNNGRFIHTI